ncbi:hypothetical protein LTR50_006324 [Elasticomyces elasticus]|nr:hypothetical protein LTR50_006324 [Elasticomyces elasticus]
MQLHEILVPAFSPASESQANEWSVRYWPTVWRNTNPWGPHPVLVSRAQEELEIAADPPPHNAAALDGEDMVNQGAMQNERMSLSNNISRALTGLNLTAQDAMAFAQRVAVEGSAAGYGLPVGCVILERKAAKTDVVAVAADARWCGLPCEKVSKTGDGARCADKGNPMAHSVMRAISMVAQKRVRGPPAVPASPNQQASSISPPLLKRDSIPGERPTVQPDSMVLTTSNHSSVTSAHAPELPLPTNLPRPTAVSPVLAHFADLPMSTTEQQVFNEFNIAGTGYLCLDLELYVTHEPCLMCCMAILHSRFGRVIFGKRMKRTGGMCASENPSLAEEFTAEELGYGLFWRRELNWKCLAWEYEGESSVDLDPKVHV